MSLVKNATAFAGADDAAILKKAEAVTRKMRTDTPADPSSGRKFCSTLEGRQFLRITWVKGYYHEEKSHQGAIVSCIYDHRNRGFGFYCKLPG
jgi:hypothetical protein